MALPKRMLAIDHDVHKALWLLAKRRGVRIGKMADKMLRSALSKAKIAVCLLCCAWGIYTTVFGLAVIARAQAPAKTEATQAAPPLPADTALAISEAWGDLQAAYIALQATSQSKTLEAAQQAYSALVGKAQAAQGIPSECQPKKGQWVKQGAPNAPPVPCMVAKVEPKK